MSMNFTAGLIVDINPVLRGFCEQPCRTGGWREEGQELLVISQREYFPWCSMKGEVFQMASFYFKQFEETSSHDVWCCVHTPPSQMWLLSTVTWSVTSGGGHNHDSHLLRDCH